MCLQPIVARQDVRISGSEVMHRTCAASGQKTTFWRQSEQIAVLRAALAAAESGQRQAELARDRVLARMEDMQRATSSVEAENQALRQNAAAQGGVVAELRQQLVAAQAQVRAQSKSHTPTSETPQDDRDPSEVRFSLLDLD